MICHGHTIDSEKFGNIVASRGHYIQAPLFLILIIGLSRVVPAQAQTQVGYMVLTAAGGSSSPVGSALFSFTNSDGVLVSEAGVAASEPIRAGRIFVDEVGSQT